jgi:hypothetical protein
MGPLKKISPSSFLLVLLLDPGSGMDKNQDPPRSATLSLAIIYFLEAHPVIP